MLTPLQSEQDILKARNALARRVQEGTQAYEARVGFQGGTATVTVHWNPRLRFWASFNGSTEWHALGRYWCSYGTQDPGEHQLLTITCETNPAVKGINRRVGGLFLRDENGRVYLAHSGRVGGGRKGIGKSAFHHAYPDGNWQEVTWPDGQRVPYLVISRIDSDRLPALISEFVFSVQRFKAGRPVVGSVPPTGSESTFSPEFAGERKPYRLSEIIESRCDHGLVIGALHGVLTGMHIQAFNDRQRDLVIPSGGTRRAVLFEVKTDLSTSSLYQGVGQLMFHGAVGGDRPLQVLVLPGRPDERTSTVLDTIGISVLCYGWEAEGVVFEDLSGILELR